MRFLYWPGSYRFPRIPGRLPFLAILPFLVPAAFAAPVTLTLSTEDRQPIHGWGLFPYYAHSNWGDAFRSVANRPLVRDRIFELGVNFIRVEICSNSYDPAGPEKLNAAALDEVKSQILMARGKGVTQWIASVWSPPAPFKSPVQDTKGDVNGVHTFLNMECREAFCEYYASALSYLRDHGCGLPVMISLQNEPNYPVPYDGSGFASKADYFETLKSMRRCLDAKDLKAVKLGGVEAAQPGDPCFFGDGSDHWKDVKAAPVDFAIAHTYGGAGWDHYQFSRAPLTRWMTEWCDISGHDEITAAVDSASHIARDLLNDGVEYWFWWNAYSPKVEAGSADLVYGEAGSPKTTKTYRMIKKLFAEVTPDGSFRVRGFTASDTSVEVGLGADYSKPVNAIAFRNAKKTVILLSNDQTGSREIVLAGIGPGTVTRVELNADSSSEKDLPELPSFALKDGTGGPFVMAPKSVQVLVIQP